MLRATATVASILLFLATIALFGVARESSSNFQQCEAQQHTQDAAEAEPKGLALIIARGIASRCTARFIVRENAVITALATVMLTFVTGGLVWISFIQLRTTQGQLRAYLIVRGKDLEEQDATRDRFIHQIEVTNTGQTPAFDVKAISRTCVLDHPIPHNFNFFIDPGRNQSAMMIGPQQSTGHDSYADVTLSPIENIKIRSENSPQRLYSYGSFIYSDAFGKKRFTNFCYFFDFITVTGPTTKPGTTDVIIKAQASPYHNDGN